MNANIAAILLVILFTLVYSCSDNSRQRRIERGLGKVISGVQEAHEILIYNQEHLEKSLIYINNKHKKSVGLLNAWQPSDYEQWGSYLKLVSEHRQLVERSKNLFEATVDLRNKGKEERYKYNNEILKLHAQIVDLMKQSKKLMARHKDKFQQVDSMVIPGSDEGVM